MDRAVPLAIGGWSARTMSHGDHLLHTLVHGAWANELAPVRWLPDAVLLARSPSLDWSAFTDAAAQRRVAGVAALTLTAAERMVPGTVPGGVVDQLSAAAARHPVERGDAWLRRLPVGALPWSLEQWLVRYVTSSTGWPFLARLRRYPGYVRFTASLGRTP